jgi:cell division septation protein DedD
MTRRTIGWLILLALGVICAPLTVGGAGLAHRLFSVRAATS